MTRGIPQAKHFQIILDTLRLRTPLAQKHKFGPGLSIYVYVGSVGNAGSYLRVCSVGKCIAESAAETRGNAPDFCRDISLCSAQFNGANMRLGYPMQNPT